MNDFNIKKFQTIIQLKHVCMIDFEEMNTGNREKDRAYINKHSSLYQMLPA